MQPLYGYFSWNVTPATEAMGMARNNNGRLARVIDGDRPALLAAKNNIQGFFSSECLQHVTTPAGVYTVVAWLSFLVQAVLSLVLIFTHVGDVHVGHACTDTNFPANCWKKNSGDFRAMNFTAGTTSLTYNPLPAGMYVGIDESYTIQTQYPFQLLVNPDAQTMKHDAGNCTNMMVGKDPNAVKACMAANVPNIFAVPNHFQYLTLSGGVHIVFFLWLALHISASFTLIMLPAKKGHQIKQYVLMLWHAFGVLLTVMLYANDDYYNVRLPVNNAILAIVIEFVSVVIQYSWTVTALEEKEEETKKLLDDPVANAETAVVVDEGNKAAAAPSAPEFPENASRIASFMRLDAQHGAGAQRGVHASNASVPHVGLPGMRYEKKSRDDMYNWDVFDSKSERMELLEPLLMQCALTLPLVMVAVMCIGHRVQMDYLVQTVYLRVFLAFGALAISERIAAISRRDVVHLLTVTEATLITQLILVVSVAVLIIYTFIDWYYPFYLTNHEYRSLGSLWGSWHVMHVAVGFVAFILFLIYAYKLIQIYLTNIQQVKFSEYDKIIYVVALGNFLLAAFYTTIAIFAITPDSWYSEYDVRDVLLNYH